MDLLVRLYDLPATAASTAALATEGVTVRRAMVHESDLVVQWVGSRFAARGWPAECRVAFARQPVACFIAVQGHRPVGFCCAEVTARGMVGPIGVDPDSRGRGIGRLMLLRVLHDLRSLGYAYAVIGQVGAAGFFARVARALPIEGSDPGPYPDDSALR